MFAQKLANSKELFIGTVNVANFDQMPNYSYWPGSLSSMEKLGHKANEPSLTRLQLANMEVLIKDRSDWKTFIALLKLGQRLKIIYQIAGGSFPLKEDLNFPGCKAVRFLLVGCLVEVADKRNYLSSFLTFLAELFI